MEAKKRHYNEFEYIQGNAARKLSAIPDYNREQENRERRQQQVRKRRSKKRQPSIDLVSLLFLTAAIMVTMYVCVEYLQVQSNITRMSKEIVSKENEIIDMKNKNAVALEEVNSSIDLAYVYEVATKQLGMVHAKSNQVITYSEKKSDYVRQYDDIPSANKSDFLDFILNK